MSDFEGYCTLRLDDNSAFNDVEIRVTIVPPKHEGSVSSWHGTLAVPEGVSAFRLLESKTGDIELSDGRRGSILFSSKVQSDRMSYQGTGPLA